MNSWYASYRRGQRVGLKMSFNGHLAKDRRQCWELCFDFFAFICYEVKG